jgi:DNA primase
VFDFFSILYQHGIEVRESGASDDEFRIHCLFCGDMGVEPDTRFRLGFNIKSGLGHCFHCGWSSRKAVIQILRRLGERDEEVSFDDFTRQTRARDTPQTLPEGFTLLAQTDLDDPLFGKARRYVEKRGITEEQLVRHGIGATVMDFRYQHSIIFPVPLKDGKLAGFVSRDYTGQRNPKYLNSCGTKVIYNVFGAYPATAIVLSEGITKALALERMLKNTICCGAILGHAITDAQVEGLAKYREVILFPDPDRAGLLGFLGVAANLQSLARKLTVAWPLPEKQADDMNESEMRAHLKGRREFSPIVQLRMRMEAGVRE